MKGMNMKVWILGFAGLIGVFAVAKVAGLCPGGSCSTSQAVAHSQAVASNVSNTLAAPAAPFESLEQAMAEAKSQNKYILVDVYTDWCHWCKKLDEDVYPAPEVQKEMHNYFTAVKINAESATSHTFGGKELTERQLATQWQVTGYPTVLFLTPDGKIVDQLPGYMPAKEFAGVLRYIGTGAYRTTSFEQWQTAHG
ncbi:MAG: thioredoxin fold domain-containing protein [Bacteroidota bacterium]|nr:thioredoxin fold domain-containing protein [Bacteroidota bacterium]MDP4231904.1 thioredoxin fold domain-containing protein [Bacteroidota bacterium]MDP4241389.1 thioredoxin fold domain-containing protein [Bacteroidota bacterium]MDP4287312.1 thioredoxin fold domain-containing protein [Bacteroidota bacterium]